MKIWLNGIATTSDDILRHNEGLDVICAVADLVSGRETAVTLGGGASCESTLSSCKTRSRISPSPMAGGCGHPACSQHYIDTGSTECIQGGE